MMENKIARRDVTAVTISMQHGAYDGDPRTSAGFSEDPRPTTIGANLPVSAPIRGRSDVSPRDEQLKGN
jgi:hypothetical protein